MALAFDARARLRRSAGVIAPIGGIAYQTVNGLENKNLEDNKHALVVFLICDIHRHHKAGYSPFMIR